MMIKSICFFLALFLHIITAELFGQGVNFTGVESLGCPTDNSIRINVVPASTVELFYEYGTTTGVYPMQTDTVTIGGGQPGEVILTSLLANTGYYYRMKYRIPGGSWIVREEHSFHTQRPAGSSFTFTVTSDSHALFNTYHQQAMVNVLSDQPDFHIDLGDTFYPGNPASQSAVNSSYLAYRNTLYLGAISPSVPVFLSSGNHEDEEGWNLDDSPFSSAVGSIQARKAFYPTPVPDRFYSGNNDLLTAIDEALYGDEYRENYYAWTWGDALFVVIDPFQYTMNLPYTPAAGEGTDDAVTGDQWSWTLGAQQFNWFKQTIQSSNARYKFVFCHQMVGGIPNLTVVGVGPGYVRGGAGAAPYFEWGGKNADGTEGFSAHRNAADFGTTPIHQLMVQNGVSAYFHGHDHQYVYETLDGVVYQEVPSPSMAGSGFSGIYSTNNPYTLKILPSTGHLRITVTPDAATVDYVRSDQNTISHTYNIAPGTSVKHTISAVAGEHGSIIPSGEVSVREGGNQDFTITPLSGYQIADVLVDGVSAGAVTSFTFSDVHASHTISVLFEEIRDVAVTYLGEVGKVAVSASGTTLQIPVGESGIAVGNLIIVGFASRGASTYNQPVVTDDAGNTYTMASGAITYGHGRSFIFYSQVENGLSEGQKITITTSPVASRVAVASVFSGITDYAALDQYLGNPESGSQTVAQGNNPFSGPSGMTTQDDELIIGMIGTEEPTDAGAGTWQNGFLEGPQVKTSGAAYEWRISMGYKITGSSGKYTAAKTVSNNPYWAANIATFKAAKKQVNQVLTFSEGYNIFSANVLPDTTDLENIFKDQINSNLLVKIMDESGRSLEDLGIFGGWTNNIGDLSLTEGYKIKVNGSCQIVIRGRQASLPMKIPLKAGWNIIGYPSNVESDAKMVVQPLIDRNTLVKVMDEKGQVIEDFGSFGGWTNNIGNFIPGGGYKIKVTTDDTLTIGNLSSTLSFQPVPAESLPGISGTPVFNREFTASGKDLTEYNNQMGICAEKPDLLRRDQRGKTIINENTLSPGTVYLWNGASENSGGDNQGTPSWKSGILR